MLEKVEANAGLIKEEDKEPLNHLNRMLNGVDTMVLGQAEYDLVDKVHTYIFNLCKDEGCPNSGTDHVCVN